MQQNLGHVKQKHKKREKIKTNCKQYQKTSIVKHKNKKQVLTNKDKT